VWLAALILLWPIPVFVLAWTKINRFYYGKQLSAHGGIIHWA